MKESIPLPTIRRLPIYVTVLKELISEGQINISTTDFSDKLSVKPIQVRKDLSYTGAIGKPKIGYNSKELLNTLIDFLGWSKANDAILVGAGSLGSALIGYHGFAKYGLNITAVFDNDPAKIGTDVRGFIVKDLQTLSRYIRKYHSTVAILTVPDIAAQSITDVMVDAGIRGIWNFSPAKISVPEGIYVQREDLAAGLAVLSVRVNNLLQ